ncbi:MAG TPA: IS5 family transposase [Rhodothermales bacterium]|nr:IS5 family transposase [Rhodothermales bacterium]
MPQHTISDEQFARIEDLLPGKASDRGVTARDNRLFINAVLWIDRNGAPWRALPEHFGNWNSVFRRFRRWAEHGVWDRIFTALQVSDSIADLEWVMLDSTSIRAHQHAAGQKKQRRQRSTRSLTGRVHNEAPRAL